jgi:hypothetical protein
MQPLAARSGLALLLATASPVGGAWAATTEFIYDFIAAARDDQGRGVYYNQTYNQQRTLSAGTLLSADAQSYSLKASVSGSNTLPFYTERANNAASVDASALIDFGLMRAKVYGHGETDTGPGPAGLPANQGDNRWAAINGGTIAAATHESIRLQSDTLDLGSDAVVEVGVLFHARVGATGWPDNCDCAFQQQLPMAELQFGNDRFTVASWETDEAWFTRYYLFTRQVGSSLPIDLYMTVRGGMNAYAPVGDVDFGPRTALTSSGFADATSTALLSVRVVTPGVSYLADSGTVYREALPLVPEPATVLLWSCAALAFAGRAGWTQRASPRPR